MTFGRRIRQLREMHKLTQSALAERIPGLTQYQLSRVELGKAELDPELSAYIAAETGVFPEFFDRPPTMDLVAHSPQFRARSSLTERVRNSSLQWAGLIDELYDGMAGGVRPIPVALRRMYGTPPK